MIELNHPQFKPSKTQNKASLINSRVSPTLSRLLYPLGCYIVLPIFFNKIKVIGKNNIPKTEPVIVAPTHRSRWDALIVPYAVGKLTSGRDLRFMVSANEVKGLQGWFIQQMGGFPVDTEHPRIVSVRHSREILSRNEMLVIFPEGGIFRNGKVNTLKRGVAHIALDVESSKPGSKVKILPVSVKYNQPYPSWGANVTVEIGSPLDVAKYLSNSLRQSSQQLTGALKTALQELHENSNL